MSRKSASEFACACPCGQVGAPRQPSTGTAHPTFVGLLFGYDTGVINGALPYMQEDLGLTH